MAERKVGTGTKLALEFGPLLAFFVGYLLWKDETFTVMGRDYSGFVAVTAAFIPIAVVSTLVLWRLSGTLSKMQVLTTVLIVVFGALTIWLNDERFFKVKPTIIYLMFAGALGFGLLRGQSYLELIMHEVVPLKRAGWMLLTRRVMLCFVVLALANEAVWRLMSTDAWVNFKTFGLPLITFAFFATQGRLFADYAPDKADLPKG